jgi:hypothetical protein
MSYLPLDDTGGVLIKSSQMPSQAAFNHKNRDITNGLSGVLIAENYLDFCVTPISFSLYLREHALEDSISYCQTFKTPGKLEFRISLWLGELFFLNGFIVSFREQE